MTTTARGVASPSSSVATPQVEALEKHAGELDELVAPDLTIGAGPSAPPTEPTKGMLVLPPAAYGHRVFVEGRVVANATAEVAVACGHRRIEIGSRGRERQIVVPCGGDVRMTYP